MLGSKHVQFRLDLFPDRRLSDSAVDGEFSVTACANSSLSDDGTPVTATPTSTDPPIITQGEEEGTFKTLSRHIGNDCTWRCELS